MRSLELRPVTGKSPSNLAARKTDRNSEPELEDCECKTRLVAADSMSIFLLARWLRIAILEKNIEDLESNWSSRPNPDSGINRNRTAESLTEESNK